MAPHARSKSTHSLAVRTTRPPGDLRRIHAAARGFTLLELMVTLAILGIVSALTMPAIAGRLLQSPLDRSTHLLKGMLEEARAESATRGEPVAVLWSPDTRRFSLPGRNGEHVLAIPTGVQVTTQGLVLATGQPGMPDARPGIVFLPLGGSTGGGLDLRSGRSSASLRTDPLTGDVEVSIAR